MPGNACGYPDPTTDAINDATQPAQGILTFIYCQCPFVRGLAITSGLE